MIFAYVRKELFRKGDFITEVLGNIFTITTNTKGNWLVKGLEKFKKNVLKHFYFKLGFCHLIKCGSLIFSLL